MKSSFLNTLIIAIASLAVFSCDKKDDPIPTPTPSPYPDLSTFTDRFLAEAKSRGLNLNTSTVEVAYVDEIKFADGSTYCGYGWTAHPTTGKRTVYISKSSPCGWAALSDLKREQFFFHEIGHAFLNRTHDNASLCDGSPITLMHAQVHANTYYDGESAKKKYYLDELFDRLAANGQCINFGQNWDTNPTFIKHQTGVGSWTFYDSKGTMTGSRSPQSALVIASIFGKTSTETGYWFTQFDSPNIPDGAKVTLRTKVSSSGLTGPGVSIAIRAYETDLQNTGAITKQSLVVSTQANPISGVINKQTLDVSISNFSRKTIYLIPFAVMLPGTQGEAIFEDFEIVVEES